jgi:hypothetical protein
MLKRLQDSYKGRTRRAIVTFTLAEIKAAGAVLTLAKTFGDIPPGAIITYTKLKRGVAVTDGAAGTFALTVGDNTTADNVMAAAAGDVDGGTSTLVVNKGAFVDGGTFKATLTGSVNLSTVTAGTFEVTVFFIA